MANEILNTDQFNKLIEEYKRQDSANDALIRQRQKADEDALMKQVQNEMAKLGQQRGQYGTDFHDSSHNAYVQNQLAKRDTVQRLAAQGLGGGLSETSQIALNNSFQNTTNQYKKQYDDNISKLDQSVREAESGRDAGLNTIRNNYASQLADNSNKYKGLIAQEQADKWQWEEELRQEAIEAQKKRDWENQRLAEQRAYEEKLAESDHQRKLALARAAQSSGTDTGSDDDDPPSPTKDELYSQMVSDEARKLTNGYHQTMSDKALRNKLEKSFSNHGINEHDYHLLLKYYSDRFEVV